MAAYASLVSLMNNIEQIQRHTRFPIHFDLKQSESLLEKVNFLIDFLENYNYRGAGEQMKDLESRITEAAYAAEHIIETHVVEKIYAYSRSSKGENMILAQAPLDHPNMEELLEAMKILNVQPRRPINTTPSATSIHTMFEKGLIQEVDMKMKDKKGKEDSGPRSGKEDNEMITMNNSTLSCLEKVMEDMDFIKEEAMKLKDKKKIQDPITGPSISSVHAGKITTMGFDNEFKQIMELLTAQERSRQVISIVGMGGIGKTTLAKTVYDKLESGRHFDFCAWVKISQECDLRKIILGLLPNESSQMNDEELGQRLHKTLNRRRYLIVLDDMWSVEAWEMVQLFLPDDDNCSRIIVTTRESSEITSVSSSSLEMKLLDENKGWDLFCEKVFAAKWCPPELEEVGRKIVKNCKGLPLSIVVIGGLLANSERTKERWEHIARDTKAIISLEDDELCMKILSLSYHNLSVHLKPCFLYIGGFPEDEEIHASILIKLWVAEGFLKSEGSKELEELAETYLNDLINRNLILVHSRRHSGKVKSCIIHDLLRDLCLKVIKNEKFMYAASTWCIHDGIQFLRNHRPISFIEHSIPQVFSTHKSVLNNFGLLRVLSNFIINENNEYSVNVSLMLVNSRLVAISNHGSYTIPFSICLSWNLRILIVKQVLEDTVFPLEIWEMTELRHLESQGRVSYLPDPPPSQQRSKQKGETTMKNLRKLKGIINFRLSEEVVKRIPNIKKLTIFYSLTGMELEEMGLNYLGLLENLESLYLAFQPGSDLLSYLTFPTSLKKLLLEECGLEWEDMSMIASIPHLEVLKLRKDAFIGSKWVLGEEEFPCLKYLQIYCCDELEQWEAGETHFPCLEHLHLFGLKKLVEIPSGIGETLQKLELLWCSNSTVNSANKIQKEQEEFGNEGLQVSVLCSNSDELESLKSDNFIVRNWNE